MKVFPEERSADKPQNLCPAQLEPLYHAAGGSMRAAFQHRMLRSSPASHAPAEAQAVLGEEQEQAELPMKRQSPFGTDVFGLTHTTPDLLSTGHSERVRRC